MPCITRRYWRKDNLSNMPCADWLVLQKGRWSNFLVVEIWSLIRKSSDLLVFHCKKCLPPYKNVYKLVHQRRLTALLIGCSDFNNLSVEPVLVL